MRILVTGSAGFIGSHTAKRLLEAGHDVVGLDNLDPYYPLALKRYNLSQLSQFPQFQFYEQNILESDTLNSLFRDVEPEIVIHLAAKAGVRNSIENPRDYFNVNVQGTLHVLEAAHAVNTRKVLAASSSSVYGNNDIVPFSESDPVESQVSPYAASKRAMEVLAKSYSEVYGLPIQLFRFFTVYGPSGRPDMAPAIFTKALLTQQALPIFGDTSSERDYTYVDDIVDGLTAAILVDDKFAIYNLGNNNPESLQNLISAAENATGNKAQINVTPRNQGDVLKTWANIDKASTMLGYKPKISLKEGMQRFATWMKDHLHLYTENKT